MTAKVTRISAILFCLTIGNYVQADSDWITLFDGQSLDGWRGYNLEEPPEGWSVEENCLTRVAEARDLITRRQFADFELCFEWKISTKGNSGVMYRVSEEEDPAYYTGPEYQVLDNPGYDVKPTAPTAAGSLYALYAPPVDASRPAGEWNQGRILVHGDHVEHWLNGQKLVTCEIGSPEWEIRVANTKFKDWPKFAKNRQGHIALQDHGDKVWYRNLRIRELH